MNSAPAGSLLAFVSQVPENAAISSFRLGTTNIAAALREDTLKVNDLLAKLGIF